MAEETKPETSTSQNVEYPQPEYSEPEKTPFIDLASLVTSLKSGKVTASDAAILITALSSLEEARYRRWMYEQQLQKKNSEDITKVVESVVSKALEKIAPAIPKEEMPSWAKQQQKLIEEIMKRLQEEEEEKKQKEIIEKVQAPLRTKISELEKTLSELHKRLEAQPEGSKERATVEQEMKKIKEILKDIKETASLLGMKEKEESTAKMGGPVLSLQGAQIPIEGKVPASMVVTPAVIESVLNSIERRVEKFLGPLTSFSPKPASSELIKLPSPPSKPAQPTSPPPKPEAKIITPPKELIRIPEKPKEQPLIKEIKMEKAKAEKKPKPAKTYKCEICGEQFTRSIDYARHVKICRRKHRGKTERKS